MKQTNALLISGVRMPNTDGVGQVLLGGIPAAAVPAPSCLAGAVGKMDGAAAWPLLAAADRFCSEVSRR
jgi:hypothetical protein